ncbi:hypothetical protein C7C56_012970 [Massilia glaciei]|uniref:Circularly permuted type 2 ATP-grasp protein n=2 Tax=Massilia glaciei TaxID=1524097 RepID=A0A2U2HKJ3_9BURK|nr:hypothetical protein C7C56_012970 [Massilia glaciei]
MLNSQCFCISLKEGALKRAIQSDLASPEVFALIEERCPHLFSARPVFVSAGQSARMALVVEAIEAVVNMPSYREHVLARAPEIARHDPGGALGVFFGYDFHLHGDRIGLIEVNTNAGGAMLNAVLARAQHACCVEMDYLRSGTGGAGGLETAIVAMFRDEWRRSGRARALARIAIVDAAPQQQYLYPEFLLFQRLFERAGIAAVIADPSELAWRDGALWHAEGEVDLVYNRLTDFLLEAPSSAALRAAYLARAVVLTPHPRAHALYADKRNLALLTDRAALDALGVPAALQAVLLANIPHTEIVRPEHAERLWQERRTLFFKPAAGYGGRAAYRGDKLTKRVWQEILEGGDYIAQQIVTPGARVSGTAESPLQYKFDIRSYTYAGRVQWTAARVYQGQTTNFRTEGGGFAPVYSIGDDDLRLRAAVRAG